MLWMSNPKHNPRAFQFYKNKCQYEIDRISPSQFGEDISFLWMKNIHINNTESFIFTGVMRFWVDPLWPMRRRTSQLSDKTVHNSILFISTQCLLSWLLFKKRIKNMDYDKKDNNNINNDPWLVEKKGVRHFLAFHSISTELIYQSFMNWFVLQHFQFAQCSSLKRNCCQVW